MEDISRKLEKEIIASTRYSPVKRRVRSKFFLIDDYGEVKSVGWLKAFLWFLSLISIAAIVAAFFLYHLYSDIRTDNAKLANELAASHKKIASLIREKEILLARLVLSGKLPHDFLDKKHKTAGADVTAAQSELTGKKITGKNLGKSKGNAILKQNKVNEKQLIDKKKIKLGKKLDEKNRKIISAGKQVSNESLKQGAVSLKQNKSMAGEQYNEAKKYKKINIEDFKIKNDAVTGDLLVRFNIRNVSAEPGNISGRIFVILKPDEKKSSWLVVPGVALKDGKPAVPKRGQYFSIARFKPVHFRIKSDSAPDSFKKASVFVFNKNKLILIRNINIKKT